MSPPSDGEVRRLTPAGVGGVAVLRVAGEGPVQALRERFNRPMPGPSGIAYGHLVGAGGADEVVDEVLVVGRSPGGVFEVHAHGSPAVVDEILNMLGGSQAPAAAGSWIERARRAVPSAPSILGARILLDQAQGALGRALGESQGEIRRLAPNERPPALMDLALRGRARARLFRPSTVVLRGPVNAGKSTLFNLLVGAEAASISSVPGTTRDALSEEVSLGPWPVRLIDTAGERDLGESLRGGDRQAEVEHQGQRIALGLAQEADLVLELRPVGEGSAPGPRSTGQRGPRVVRLGTQADRHLGPDPAQWPPLTVSAVEQPDRARGTVLRAFVQAFGLEADPGSLWSPGQAVPFDDIAIGAIEEAALDSRVQAAREPNRGLRAEVSDAALDALMEQL